MKKDGKQLVIYIYIYKEDGICNQSMTITSGGALSRTAFSSKTWTI